MKILLYAILITTGMIVVTGFAALETVQYQYDRSGRLILAYYKAGATNAAIVYQYDPNGNRTNQVNIAANHDAYDSDSDTLGDLQELTFFGDLDEDGSGDPDQDGLNNASEFTLSGNPNLPDTDLDGMNDLNESIAGTALNDKNSIFRIIKIGVPSGNQVNLGWNVVANRTYQLQMKYELAEDSWFNVGDPHNADTSGYYEVDGQRLDPQAFFRVQLELTQ